MTSPLGKSDHAVLFLTCKFDTSCKTLGQQYNYGKGDYENLCKLFMDIDWEPHLRKCSSVDAKWLLLVNRLFAEGIEKLVPKISIFMNDARCPGDVLCLGMYERKLDKNIGYGIEKQQKETRKTFGPMLKTKLY